MGGFLSLKPQGLFLGASFLCAKRALSMANCYLCSVYLPRGEGNRMQCLTSIRAGRSRRVLNFFGSISSGKTYTLRTVCDNCFAANQPQPINIGRLIGLCFRGFLIFVAVIILFVLFVRGYYKIYGRAPWQ